MKQHYLNLIIMGILLLLPALLLAEDRWLRSCLAKNSTVVFRNRVSAGGMPSLSCYPETVYLAVGDDKQAASGCEIGVLTKS